MNENTFTIHTLPKIHASKYNPYNLDVRAKFAIAICYAISVAIARTSGAFLMASVLPIALAFTLSNSSLRTLAKINLLNLFMLVTMILTFPDFKAALIIILRLNFTCVVFAKLFETTSFYIPDPKFVPKKIRVLLILTIRGIFMLQDCLHSSILSVKMRAPNLHGVLKWKVFAYVIASSILRSESRSEKMLLAIKMRGGFAGFEQGRDLNWKFSDSVICVLSGIYVTGIFLA